MMPDKYVLGIEGGGSRTNWVYLKQTETQSDLIEEGDLPASNWKLTPEPRLRRLFMVLPKHATHVGVFLAGCVTQQDRKRLQQLAQSIWTDASICAGSDRESGMAAAFGHRDGITVISGTGSAVTGKKGKHIEKAGGRGHLLGDRGGAYVISIEGLRLALRTYDLEHRTSMLSQHILRDLALSDMEDLINWVQSADKTAISSLAPVLFETAMKGDQEMMEVIAAGARALARYTQSVATWLNYDSPDVRLLGSIFLNQPIYVDLYKKALDSILKTNSIEICTTPGSFGAAWLASEGLPLPGNLGDQFAQTDIDALENAPTEQENPRAAGLSHRSTSDLISLFIEQEKDVMTALRSCEVQLAVAVDLLVSTLSKGGRLFYIGAGTSGRLGVLDASEIPPTFGESPDRVQGIIAGGVSALYKSIEGAEDETGKAIFTIHDRGVNALDVVCGITASGRTPFVLAALQEAKQIGARTILLTCNPARNHQQNWDVEIDLPSGPEIITGSTRLKAGTVTKCALNILTTCSMIRLGRTKDNSMIDLKAVNSKLKLRAIKLVSRIKNISSDEAQNLLETCNWNVRQALE
jgi:N-acetylmuramic acid 6-phosphate etherase